MKSRITSIINSNFQQPYASNCCGAYSLTAILDAFGVFNIFCDGKNLDEGDSISIKFNNRESVISKGSYLKGIANEFYRITGDPNFNCQNLPDSLVYIAAKFLDLKTYDIYLNITEESYNQVIQTYPAYQALVEKCAKIIGKDHVNTKAKIEDYKVPKGNWCQHLVVQISSEYDYGDLHWIARDGRGLYFDPICGTSGNEWEDLTTFDPIQSRFLTLKTSASIVMSDVVHCKLPTQLVNLEYNWIGFWIDYKKKND